MIGINTSKLVGTGLVALAVSAGLTLPSLSQEKVKVYVSAGFDGNTWMDASLNLLQAIAKTSAYKDTVEIDVQSARGDAQVQQQQINAMVQAGADVIVAWPISPTALNRAVRNACEQGVVFITWDAQVTEPCAHYVGINQDWAGAGPAEWLAQELGGKGNIIFMGGIPGTMVDTRRNEAAKAVFAEHPEINIVADTPSMWNNATARQKLSEIVAAQGWDNIDGLWTQTGCHEFALLQARSRSGHIPALRRQRIQRRACFATPGRYDGRRARRSRGIDGFAALGGPVRLQAWIEASSG
jgi:ribose transport system substrate-binding protein